MTTSPRCRALVPRSLPDAALLAALGTGDLAPLGDLYARHARAASGAP